MMEAAGKLSSLVSICRSKVAHKHNIGKLIKHVNSLKKKLYISKTIHTRAESGV